MKIVDPSCCKQTTYVSAPPTATYSNGHSSENGQRGIFSNFHWTESDRLAPSCKFLGQNSEYPALQNLGNFLLRPKISKSRHIIPHKTANRWHIQKSKPRCLGHPRLHLWTDAWWNQSMPSTLKLPLGPLRHLKLETLEIFGFWILDF